MQNGDGIAVSKRNDLGWLGIAGGWYGE